MAFTVFMLVMCLASLAACKSTTSLDTLSSQLQGIMSLLQTDNGGDNNSLDKKLTTITDRLDRLEANINTLVSAMDGQTSVFPSGHKESDVEALAGRVSALAKGFRDEKARVRRQVASLKAVVIDKTNTDTEDRKLLIEILNQTKDIGSMCNTESVKEVAQEQSKPTSCQDIMLSGGNISGVYDIFPVGSSDPVRVFCDQETDGGGWIVFQRRRDYMQDFNRGWNDYKHGFGDIRGEFWLGNDILHRLTNGCCYVLLITMGSTCVRIDVRCGSFSIGPESDDYRIRCQQLCEESPFRDELNGKRFSTKDNYDSIDSRNCASDQGGGWWYDINCINGNNLNSNENNEERKIKNITTEMKFR